MKVTQDWLDQNKTKAGGYTKRQLEIIGVEWPPQRGWKACVIGSDIQDVLADEFEAIAIATREK